MRRYTDVVVLVLDEVGYLPIDKAGADMLFQVLAARYEKASTILTTNRAYKHWQETFNSDATLTAHPIQSRTAVGATLRRRFPSIHPSTVFKPAGSFGFHSVADTRSVSWSQRTHPRWASSRD
jgi:hypothetical protein